MGFWRSLWDIQRFQRAVHYSVLYLGSTAAAYTYANIAVRAHVPLAATPYSGYPAGSELLFDASKLYKRALDHVFLEEEDVEDGEGGGGEWGPLQYTIVAKHFERQGQAAYAYHSHYMAHLLSQGKVDGTKPTF